VWLIKNKTKAKLWKCSVRCPYPHKKNFLHGDFRSVKKKEAGEPTPWYKIEGGKSTEESLEGLGTIRDWDEGGVMARKRLDLKTRGGCWGKKCTETKKSWEIMNVKLKSGGLIGVLGPDLIG